MRSPASSPGSQVSARRALASNSLASRSRARYLGGGRVRERDRAARLPQITTHDYLTLTVVADEDVLPTLRQARGVTTRWELPEEPVMAVCTAGAACNKVGCGGLGRSKCRHDAGASIGLWQMPERDPVTCLPVVSNGHVVDAGVRALLATLPERQRLVLFATTPIWITGRSQRRSRSSQERSARPSTRRIRR